MEIVALIFGIIGFVFGLSAIGQIEKLKKDVRRLRKSLEKGADETSVSTS